MNRSHFHRAVATTVALNIALIAGSASAQIERPAVETLQLTLEDAVRRAVEHNPDLAIVRLGTQVEAAHVGETRSAFTPMLSTLVGRSSSVTPPFNFLLGDRGVDVNDLFSSTSVRQRLQRGGGTWSLSWDSSRTTTSSPLSSFAPSLESRFQIAFSQPLLKDRKMDAARQQYIIAKRNQESSELRFRESVVQTVASVKQAYWTLKALVANVTVQQRSLELAEELVRQNKVRVDVGQAPLLDLLQAEAEEAQRRETVILADTAAQDAEDRLRRLIMDPADTAFWQIRVNAIDEPAGRIPLPDVDEVVTNAFNGRYDLARAHIEHNNANTNVEFLSNQMLPDVRFEASYGSSGLGGTQLVRTGAFPGVVTARLTTGLGNVLNQVFTRDYPTWSLGFTVSYPLGRSYEEVGLVRAEIERRQAARRVVSLQLQAVGNIRQAARQVRSTVERENAARTGAALAMQRFDAEQRRYEVGLSTSFLVTQAQRDLAQGQVGLLQAALDYQSALVKFEALQLAPPLTAGDTLALKGSNIVLLPTAAPSGLFRQGAGLGF